MDTYKDDTKHISVEDSTQQIELASETERERAVNVSSIVSTEQILDAQRRTAAERRLVRKLDLRLLPTIFLIYIVNYIDRNAISTARLKGLEQDLHLTGKLLYYNFDVQYDTVVAILFASYCPANVPSNMIINRISRPSIYIGACVVLWGLTSALTGITQNFAGMMACRFFIGLPEAAFYPGAIFLLSRWYTKKELAFRSAFLYTGLLVSNAFGNLMAAGILSGMEGVRGIRAWRCTPNLFVYVLHFSTELPPQGAISVLIGFLSMWALPNYPENTAWLSQEERILAQVRMAEDAGEADKDSSTDSMWSGLRMAMKDVKTYLFAMLSLGQLLGLSFVNFFPTLTAALGFNTTITLLMGAPPWIWATAACLFNAIHADKTGERFHHITLPWWSVIVGYIISISTFSVAGRYFSLFLMASGYAVSNTLPRPPAKRAAAIGVIYGVGNLGNLIGSYVWKVEWGPQYTQSMAICISSMGFSIMLALIIRRMLMLENKRLDEDELGASRGVDRERIEEFAKLEGITVKEALEKKRGFRYLY
ncbi:MFS general substrate transporter [Schizopora paradoxa]|uniref:MFS general substrate transporter n=1 Tax=Schizopora paradoxa TaxID=27342 RepID=A0A0H2SFG9_9AGAM|nr:MFS general substrate transporter [Schizopora paradoxa]